jgi:thiamine kinase-like enzyme
MERYNFTDVAIRWTHQAITIKDFDSMLDKLFYFINKRAVKSVDPSTYNEVKTELYLNKVITRVNQLKNAANYDLIANYIASGTKFSDIDGIVEFYRLNYEKIAKTVSLSPQLVVGHGDLCFSNILYDKDTTTLKLIDPKGALVEDELWTDPYYDVAKLSHSVCGYYDYINSGMVDIGVSESLELELIFDVKVDLYQERFKEYLKENGFDYKLVRLLEASLFLSMLPLHMDHPQKVLAQILNAVRILKEINIDV